MRAVVPEHLQGLKSISPRLLEAEEAGEPELEVPSPGTTRNQKYIYKFLSKDSRVAFSSIRVCS